MIDNLAKIEVCAVFHSRAFQKSVSPKFIKLCIETPTNNRNICCLVLFLKQKIISLEFRHIKSNNSSSASTVQLAKTW